MRAMQAMNFADTESNKFCMCVGSPSVFCPLSLFLDKKEEHSYFVFMFLVTYTNYTFQLI